MYKRVWVINLKPSISSQKMCKELHSKIDIVDEERYDCEYKVGKHNKDVSFQTLSLFNAPVLHLYTLRKVRDLSYLLDPWAETEDTGPWRQVQKACPEEGEGVCRWDDESSSWLQTQGLHGPQSQPQVREEGGRQTGQGTGVNAPKHSAWGRTFGPWEMMCFNLPSLFNPRCSLLKSATGVRTWRPCQAWRAARRCSTQVVEHSETLCEVSCIWWGWSTESRDEEVI